MKSDSYNVYKQLLLKLHEMNVRGTDQTPEANDMRADMEQPWYAMTEQEQDRLGNLSGDLYMLTGEEIKEKAASRFEIREFMAIFNDGRWDEALRKLRADSVPPPDQRVAILRSICWMALGDLDVALLFAEYASRLMPENVNYRAIVTWLKFNLGKTIDPSEIRLASVAFGCSDLEPSKQLEAIRSTTQDNILKMSSNFDLGPLKKSA